MITPKQKYRYRRGSTSESNWCKRCVYIQRGVDWMTLGGQCFTFKAEVNSIEDVPVASIQEGFTCKAFKEEPGYIPEYRI